MPPSTDQHQHQHQHHDLQSQSQSQSHPKPNPNLLSLFLKPIIMLLLTSLFFLFLGFAAFLLLHLFLLGGAFHRLRSRPTAAATSSSSTGLTPRQINKLPRFRLSKPQPDSQCVVCLDAFRTGHCCRKLTACGHVFHRRCVDTWLIKVAACPTCRTPVNSGTPLHHPIEPSFGTDTNALTLL